MNKRFLLLFLVFHGTVLSAQEKNRIQYVLPDNVEAILDSCIKKMMSTGNSFYFLLEKDTSYCITIGTYKKSEQKDFLSWVTRTNRYILINKRMYPLIFDYDSKFGTVDEHIGKFRHRDDHVKKVHLLIHGISIFFKPDGTISNITK